MNSLLSRRILLSAMAALPALSAFRAMPAQAQVSGDWLPSWNEGPTKASIIDFVERLSEGIGGASGVRRVALATSEPLGGGAYTFAREGQTFEKPEDQPAVRRIAATPSYFDALKLAGSIASLYLPDTTGANPVRD